MTPKLDECKRFLIIKLSSIGDVVLTTPVAKALRGAFPDSYIAWVVEPKSKDIIEGNPYLDDVIVWERKASSGVSDVFSALSSLRPIVSSLRSRRFDVALDLQGLLRSAALARLCGAPYRVGFTNTREGAALLYNVRKPAGEGTIRGSQHYLSLLEMLGVHSADTDMHVPVQPEDREFASRLLADASRGKSPGRVVAMCPATTWPQKHWTEEGWAGLADALIANYDALPVFLGSPANIPLFERIRSLMTGEPASAVGRTTLKQAAAIQELSDLVIAVDTGLMHVAAAVKRPVVGIFGPTRWKHLETEDNLSVLVKEFPCMPCLRHPVCRDFDCMRAITVDDVLSTVSRVLG